MQWPRSVSVPTTLYRLAVWPLIPDVTLTDMLTLVNGSNAASFLSKVSSTSLSCDANGSYSPLAVWAAADVLSANAVPVVGGWGSTGSGSGFLHADTMLQPQVRNIAP